MSASKKDTKSMRCHQESSEIRFHEDFHEAEVENTNKALSKFHRYCFNFVADWKGNSASQARRGEQEQDANDSNETEKNLRLSFVLHFTTT